MDKVSDTTIQITGTCVKLSTSCRFARNNVFGCCREALAMRTGPDILYFMKLSLLQAIVTLTMVLIFGNKV